MNLQTYLMIKYAYNYDGINPDLVNRLESAKSLFSASADTNKARAAAGSTLPQLPENFQQMNNTIRDFNATSTPGGRPRGSILRSLFVKDVYKGAKDVATGMRGQVNPYGSLAKILPRR